MGIAIGDVRQWVERFEPLDGRQQRSRAETLRLLDHDPEPLRRWRFAPGHVTASALVLGPSNHVLLVFHPRLRMWLQPGGHVEPTDDSVVAAAAREVFEETGVRVDDAVPPALVSVDVHDIPASRREPAHRHHDLMFRFVTSGGSGETRHPWPGVAWCRPDCLHEFHADAPLLAAVARALSGRGRDGTSRRDRVPA